MKNTPSGNPAFSCDQFVSLCEVHRRFYFSSEKHPSDKKCCGAIFNPVPIL
jgi:hypothetical protein